MDTPTLIGLHGARGAGKDTTYQFIADWCAGSDPALSAVRRGFADRMKWAYARQFFPGISMQDAIEWTNSLKGTDAKVIFPAWDPVPGGGRSEGIWKDTAVNFRDHMNQFATESARDIYGINHWVDQVLPAEPSYSNPEGWKGSFMVPPRTADEDPYSFAHFAVITDLRAENEMERIAGLGGLLVKVRRKDAEDKQLAYYEEKGIPPHLFASDLSDSYFDVILVNDDNDMDKSRVRTHTLLDAIKDNGAAGIKVYANRLGEPWRITL